MFTACVGVQDEPGGRYASVDELKSSVRKAALDESRHAAPPPPPSPPPSSQRRSQSLNIGGGGGASEEGGRRRNSSEIKKDALRDIFFGDSDRESTDSSKGGEPNILTSRTSVLSSGSSRAFAANEESGYCIRPCSIKKPYQCLHVLKGISFRYRYNVGWMFNDESSVCVRCDEDFTTYRRKHHCR